MNSWMAHLQLSFGVMRPPPHTWAQFGKMAQNKKSFKLIMTDMASLYSNTHRSREPFLLAVPK